MNRSWIGIRASAVLAILGSLLTMLMGILTAVSAFVEPAPKYSPVPLKPVLFATGGFFAVFAAWGIATAVAIFLRKRWSRISILVFAGFLAVVGVIGMLMVPFFQMPETPNADTPENLGMMVRIGMAAVYGVCGAIGIWWLVLFTRPRTKEYYGAQDIPADPRPLSIRIIAWWMLITGLLVLPCSLFHFPTVMFGAILTGWLATGVFAVLGAAQVLLGQGLLRMREWARVGTIVMIGILAASSIVTMVHPGWNEAMRLMMTAMPSFNEGVAQQRMLGPMWIFALFGLAFLAVPLYFLVRRSAAFTTPAAPTSV
jgi:hypothetical protein